MEKQPLEGKRVLVLAGDGFEDSELLYPMIRLREAGAKVTVAGMEAGKEYHGKNGYPVKAEKSVASIKADDFDALVIPGGQMPDKLRIEDAVLRLTKQFAEAKKCIAAVCHGPQILISAKLTQGRTMTSYKSVKDDLINSGATYQDQAAVVDGNFITSRTPDDLGDFCKAIIQALGKAS